MSKNKKLITNVVLSLAFLMVANFASAALPSLVPECARGAQPTAADLDCLLQVGVNVVQLILGISGSLALVYFLYGGFLWLTAAGAPKKIEDGKNIIINSVIGLAIIFGAFALVQFAVKALGIGAEFTKTVPKVENFK